MKRLLPIGLIGCAVIGMAAAAPKATSPAWPCFRGPGADGISTESGWNPEALSGATKVAWKASVGKGWAAVAVRDGRVYTTGNVDNQDIVFALDAATGREIWRHAYPCKGGGGGYPGPRATPAADGGDVFTVSVEGHVFCLDAAKGAVKWRANLVSDFKAAPPKWGHSASPRVDGPLLLLNGCSGGIALDKKTGKPVWTGKPGIGGYSCPVPFGPPDKRMIALFGEKAFQAVAAKTGALIMSHPWETNYNVNAADPLVTPAGVFITSGYGRGCAMLDVSGGAPKVAWENKKICAHFSSPVFLNGFLYGIDGSAGGGTLRCLDAKTGSETWSENTGFGGLMAVDGKLIVLSEKGALRIFAADPAGCKKLSEGTVAGQGKFWTSPVLCGGKIYCRSSEGDLTAVDVSQ
ncbi:MAG: PQQ-binding-like beta-propeller repeat protein [Planctomycetota bacterium]